MRKTLRSSVVKATTPTIASYLFILTCVLWINSTVCRAASQEPVHSSQNTFTVIGTDWGSSSRHARRRAEEALPLQQMAESDRRAIQKSIQSTTLFRRLPVELFACDGDLLACSLDKPEASVDIWRLLGISRLSLDPTGPDQWQFSDGYGTVGQLRLAYRERRPNGGMLVFHGKGAYKGPLSPKNLTGGCVLMIRYREAEPTVDGRLRQPFRSMLFWIWMELALRLSHAHSSLSLLDPPQPTFMKSAFMSSLSDAAASNPEGVARLANRLKRTVPIDRQALATIARETAQRQKVKTDMPLEQTASPDQLRVDLAARWLPADDLQNLQLQQ